MRAVILLSAFFLRRYVYRSHLVASTAVRLFVYDVQRNLFYLLEIPVSALGLLLPVAGVQVVYLKCFNIAINERALKKKGILITLLDH